MEGDKYLCPNCGMPIPPDKINFKTRRAYCDFCAQNVIFPRRTSTASRSAREAIRNAEVSFFSGDINSAVHFAQTAVEMVPDHVGALYIIAYHKAFVADVKNRTLLNKLFSDILPNAEFDDEEEELFKRLLLTTILHTVEYEEDILLKFSAYDDDAEVADFVEKFSPFAINKRNNINWLTPDLVDIYKEISRKSNIPKTWYAMYQSLIKNQDSPFVANTFFLRTKTKRYYDEYLVPIGQIFASIGDSALKEKFVNAYNKVKTQCEQRMSRSD